MVIGVWFCYGENRLVGLGLSRFTNGFMEGLKEAFLVAELLVEDYCYWVVVVAVGY